MEAIELARDISVVFLSLICFAFLLVPGVILFFAQKYLRLGRKKLRVPLLQAQVWAIRVENQSLKTAERIVGVPIAVQERWARLQGTARALGPGSSRAMVKRDG